MITDLLSDWSFLPESKEYDINTDVKCSPYMKQLCFWFLDDIYAIGGGKSDLYTSIQTHIFLRQLVLRGHLLCVCCDIVGLGSSEFFLNSIPEQLYGKS